MNGAQTLVGLGGGALIIANYITSGSAQRTPIANALSQSKTPASGLASAHAALVEIACEALFVLVATVLSGLNDGLGKAMIAVVVGLWILWAMHHFAASSASGTSTASSGNVVNIRKNAA